jgi:hypothetical protein
MNQEKYQIDWKMYAPVEEQWMLGKSSLGREQAFFHNGWYDGLTPSMLSEHMFVQHSLVPTLQETNKSSWVNLRTWVPTFLIELCSWVNLRTWVPTFLC